MTIQGVLLCAGLLILGCNLTVLAIMVKLYTEVFKKQTIEGIGK